MSAYFVYHPGYTLPFGEHVFPVHKYEMIHRQATGAGTLSDAEILTPDPASDEQILAVHSQPYLDRLHRYARQDPMAGVMELEAPCLPEVLAAFYLMTGGTILATEQALAGGGAGVNIGGGFHHAEAHRGGGFCFINDIAVSVKLALEGGKASNALVIDTDVHQGNGTAEIFLDEPGVTIVDIHQRNNYPVKQPAECNIGLPDGCGDDEYMDRLEAGLDQTLQEHGPFDLVHYVAGADPWREDQLGGLCLSKEGLARRDQLVIGVAKRLEAPLVVTFAGGYGRRIEDVVEIHVALIKAVKEGWPAASGK